jgi:hypothetical protein
MLSERQIEMWRPARDLPIWIPARVARRTTSPNPNPEHR